MGNHSSEATVKLSDFCAQNKESEGERKTAQHWERDSFSRVIGEEIDLGEKKINLQSPSIPYCDFSRACY